MTLTENSPTFVTLLAFREAWKQVMNDYSRLRLTSEGCLQAAVYFHLRNQLDAIGYRIFVEAVTRLPSSDNEWKKRAVVDLLVEHDGNIVLVIELKYCPKTMPTKDAICKDLHTLSKYANARSKSDRAIVNLMRFRNDDVKSLNLRITQETYRVLGIFCGEDIRFDEEEVFWRSFKPRVGRWCRLRKMPKRLGVAIASKQQGASLQPRYLGHLDRLPED